MTANSAVPVSWVEHRVKSLVSKHNR